MAIDKFGRSRSSSAACKRSHQSTLTFGYVLTPDGDIDLQTKRICNLNLVPSADNEATSKQYVDDLNKTITNEVRTQFFNINGKVKTLNNAHHSEAEKSTSLLEKLNIIISTNKTVQSRLAAIEKLINEK